MLQVQHLSIEIRARLDCYVLDYFDQEHRIISWRELLPRASFMRLRGYTVLLPLPEDQRSSITVERLFLETHQPELVLLLAYRAGANLLTQFLLVCRWFPHEPFYITTVFHHCALPALMPIQGARQ